MTDSRVAPELVFEAIRNSDVALFESYLKQGTDTEARNDSTNTMLLFTCVLGKAHMSSLLVQAGANVNAQGHNKMSPLMMAMSFSMNKLAEELLERNADTALADKFGNTALDHAKASDNMAGAALLLKRLSAVQVQAEMFRALREENLPVLKILVVDCGADLTLKNERGVPAYDLAEVASDFEIIDFVRGATAHHSAQQLSAGIGAGHTAPKTARFTRRL
ncbi:MAG: ankyrin repeat domain-containing protein [Alphaproteobacteria bacterium]|nr:ankyrin repeat domain-containing protein [Alphaproteobacteria bacterium]